MPLFAAFTCDLCTTATATMPLEDGVIDMPKDWMTLAIGTADMVLPRELDAAAAVADPEDGPAFEAEKEPFRISLYVCPDCRPSIAVIDDIVRARFKERDEVEPEPAPPADERVIDLHSRKK